MFIANIFMGLLICSVIACQVLQITLAASAGEYGTALTKSLLYFESQRSGKLPPNQRVQWRGDSGLKDGSDARIDLTGGYYDAGDNVKFGFPMAFTITMLSWGTIEFGDNLSKKKELDNALAAIKWGTDYLIKAHPKPDILYGEVGDGDSDHACWQRPEDMTTPRTPYKIDKDHPGSDLAAETVAALAAASIAFRRTNPHYADILVTHATQLFDLARNHPGMYQNSIPVAGKFYSSSGFEDELMWAAAWLHLATGEDSFLSYIDSASATNSGGSRSSFNWDDKFVGLQVLAAKIIQEYGSQDYLEELKGYAEEFICNLAQKGSNNVHKSPGGLLWFQPWNNLQYTTAATFVASVYAKYLSASSATVDCQGDSVGPSDLTNLVKSQVDYILGYNPGNMSYMVGFGSKFPTQVHHRGASIVSIKKDRTPVECKAGFGLWLNKNAPNPNVLDGAIVGGPDDKDSYSDSRSNFQQAEPAIANTAPLVGVLASLV